MVAIATVCGVFVFRPKSKQPLMMRKAKFGAKYNGRLMPYGTHFQAGR
ncbi:hypothetical protein INT82_03795 [Mannheimia haemolytica]|nr:hypothetical protein [Mannheimia haemolytica]